MYVHIFYFYTVLLYHVSLLEANKFTTYLLTYAGHSWGPCFIPHLPQWNISWFLLSGRSFPVAGVYFPLCDFLTTSRVASDAASCLISYTLALPRNLGRLKSFFFKASMDYLIWWENYQYCNWSSSSICCGDIFVSSNTSIISFILMWNMSIDSF